MLVYLVTSVVFQPQIGLKLSAIGAIYVAFTVPCAVSSIVVGMLTDKLVRNTLV